MTRVAFWFDRPQAYTGGLNYIRNLLHAIAAVGDGTVAPYVFFGKQVDDDVARQFSSLATVVRTSVLDRKSFLWFVQQVLYRICGSSWLVQHVLGRHRIEVVSHAEQVPRLGARLRTISWIPDLQYLHLPALFPGLDAAAETRRLIRMVEQADAIVLSSHAARVDFERIAPHELLDRVVVLPFVSQPNTGLSSDGVTLSAAAIEAKYGFEGRFFFLPNQFWTHKNHQAAFEAVRLLRDRGIDVLLLCTGNLRDYRMKDNAHAEGLQAFVREHGLNANIRILGLIDYQDVLMLMKYCVAVINPSRFEGWSSTVEEAKSIGKQLVLSDIAVHLEQAAPGARYFAPDEPAALADILAELWQSAPQGLDALRQSQASAQLQERTLGYGRAYLALVRRLVTRVPSTAGERVGS